MPLPLPSVEELGHILLKCQTERNLLRALRMQDYMQESGLQAHTRLGNRLVSMLVEVESMHHSQHVVDQTEYPDKCSWNSAIIDCVQEGNFQNALSYYDKMREDISLQPNGYAFVALLKACATLRDLARGLQLYEHIAETNLLQTNEFVASTLVDMFAKSGSLSKAQEVFDALTCRSVIMWNALITGYADYRHGEKVLNYLKQMQQEGISPDAVTFVCGLRACGNIRDGCEGWQLNVEIVKKGLEGNLAVGSTLVDMYGKCGCLASAQEVFDKLLNRNVVSWNALITGYAEHGHGEEVLHCYERMHSEGIPANAVTFVCILKACACIRGIDKGQDTHTDIVKKGFEKDLQVGCSLVDMYAKSAFLASAQVSFDKLPAPDAVLWNALITGYMEQGCNQEALECFEQMQNQLVSPNSVTYVSILKAWGSTGGIDERQKIHISILKRGLDKDLFVGSSLVDMYIKSGLLVEAQSVFNKIPFQTLVTWNSLIAGYADHGQVEKALECFEQMQHDGISSDAITLVCILKAYASIGDIIKGQEIHAEMIKKGFLENDVYTGSTLVDVYARFGLVAEAERVFERLSIKDEFTWTALIAGYAENGRIEDAFDLFKCLQHENVVYSAGMFVCIVRAVGSRNVIDMGQELHAEIIQKGMMERDSVFVSSLVDMYAKCGLLAEAQHTFDTLPVRDVELWTTLMTGYAEHVGGEAALKCFEQMQNEHLSPTVSAFVLGMKACGSLGATIKGRAMHADIVKKGLERESFIPNALVDMHAKWGLLGESQAIFDSLAGRDIVTWNALITGYVEHREGEEAVHCFEQMHHHGISPNTTTLVSMLKACGSAGGWIKGRDIYCEICKKGLEKELFVGSTLIDMYVKCGSLVEAQCVFNKLPIHVLVSWNALIAGYAEHLHGGEALNCFEQMQQEDIPPDAVTFVCCLKACAAVKSLVKGRGLYADIVTRGLEKEILIGNILVDMYAKCGSLSEAQEVFDKLPTRTIISCTALIAGYAECECGEDALLCLEQMQHQSIPLGPVTFICSLKACGSLLAVNKGQELHAEIVKKGLLERGVFAGSALVDMYSNCGLLLEAQDVFIKLPLRDSVSWTALIAGLSEHGCSEGAIHHFEQMKQMGFSPDAITFVCSLKACGSMGAAVKGEEIHVEIVKKGLECDLFVGEILVGMYTKCGLLTTAQSVFNKLQVRDVLLWNALVAGYAHLGDVFWIFNKMVAESAKPDVSTFVNMLTACNHAGLVDEGLMYINHMRDEYNIVPAREHYSCIIDLLGRAGRIDFVAITINELPFHPDVALWLSVLGACKKWGIVDLGKLAFENAVLLNEKDVAAYVCMSNIYADAAMGEKAIRMDTLKVEKGAWEMSGQDQWIAA